MDLNFKVIHQRLFYKEKKYLVSKSDNYIRLLFDFETTDWNKLNKYVILKNEEEESFQFKYDNEGLIVPYDVVKNKNFFVSIYGANDEYRITTNIITVKLFTSGYTTDISSTIESSKDIIVELDNKIDKKVGFGDISRVGLSGEYNDLLDIPTEFNPISHNHDEYLIDVDVEELIAIHNYAEDSHSDIRESIPSKLSDLDNDSNFLTEHQSLNGYYTKREIDTYLDGKVTKINNKGLSTEDYTTSEKNKLSNLENYDDSIILSRLDDLEQLISENNNSNNIRLIALKVPQEIIEREGGILKSYNGFNAYLSIQYGDEYHCINHYSEVINNIEYYVFEFINIPNGEEYVLSVKNNNGIVNILTFDIINGQDEYVIEATSEDISIKNI